MGSDDWVGDKINILPRWLECSLLNNCGLLLHAHYIKHIPIKNGRIAKLIEF
jgi:hypothetical protein